ncbi:Autophagy-related protein 17 [Pleurostoma richardsiae]|uniref:Autophagy-related protein 17 n=1 Tax=Pleurostoma richardsiae TaxID=41990 RepID=A0AA38R6S7_9PEZI|nr:Autophagy-related protein 17 [Pleurostoma richardsiae]
MASPSAASSSPASSRRGSIPGAAASVPVETLVEHLLAAKRALNSMTLVLHANHLTTQARQLHEEAVILAAQTGFLRRGIREQHRLLLRIRKSMARTHENGKREFKHLIRTLDAANGKLEQTMEMLRKTVVEPIFRPAGEEPRNLLDFVDEKSVDDMRNAVKQSIVELQNIQTSFDGDLLRLETDIRHLKQALSGAPSPPSPSASTNYQPMPQLLASLTEHSHAMAEHLTSLTRHFDMCVTAVRITEGGAALARRKAAEVTESQDGGDPVSISGVIAEQESDVADLEPLTAEERAEIVQVVVQDAPEVGEVVEDLHEALRQVDADFASLKEQADQVRQAYAATTAAFRILEDIGSRLHSYVAAEGEYLERWEDERQAIAARLEEMDGLREFYEGYAGAYDSLILEVERRRSVEERIEAIWRKARDSVDRLVDADWRERETFRQEVGDFLPTDLWVGMSGPLQRWDIVPAQAQQQEEAEGSNSAGAPGGKQEENSTPGLDKSVVEAAKQRLGRVVR